MDAPRFAVLPEPVPAEQLVASQPVHPPTGPAGDALAEVLRTADAAVADADGD